MYKFITITADNASNNRTMMASLATRLCCTDPVGDYDSDHSTICCLAHVIHLLVMDLLVNIKAVHSSPQRVDDFQSYIKHYNSSVHEGLNSDVPPAVKDLVPELIPILNVPTCWKSTFSGH